MSNLSSTQHAALQRIRIVMVNTTLPANIGAAARALKTMGLCRLVLVAPKTYPSDDATALAAGAGDILAQAQVVDSLQDAIADCQLVFGTSARSRTIPWPLLNARDACQLAMTDAISTAHEIAIVFGREDRGLTNEELSLCNYHLTIPVNDDYGVLNVSAAIQVICYELRMSLLAQQPTPDNEPNKPRMPLNHIGHTPDTTQPDMPWDEPLATQAQMAQFYPHMEAMLNAIEFLDPDNPRLLPLRLRRLFGRVRLDRVEYNLLRGIFGRVQALSKGTWSPNMHNQQTTTKDTPSQHTYAEPSDD